MLEKVTGKTAEINFRDPRPGDVLHSAADNASLQSLFPDIEPIDLQEGLRQTADWFREKYPELS